MIVRIGTFDQWNGTAGTITLPANKVKAYRQKAEQAGVIITSSKPVRA